MSITIDLRRAEFILSAAKPAQFPLDRGREVAFVGRSNAGKSSALNTMTQQKNLCRVSKTPGRTQLINFFSLNEDTRLVDLPGYGYASVPLAIKRQWHVLIEQYLQSRASLQGLILLMDIRHPLTELDQQLLYWAGLRHLPVHILLTKADKLRYGAQKQALLAVEKALADHEQVSVQLFSSLAKIGLEDCHKQLSYWLTHHERNNPII